MDNQRLIKYLNQLLANASIMHMKLLRYHWYSQGNRALNLRNEFYQDHLQFKTFILALGETILTIDGKPLATFAKYLAETTLEEASAETYLSEMMEQLEKDYLTIIQDMKSEGIYLADHLKDQQTYKFLLSWLQILEKKLQEIKAYQVE